MHCTKFLQFWKKKYCSRQSQGACSQIYSQGWTFIIISGFYILKSLAFWSVFVTLQTMIKGIVQECLKFLRIEESFFFSLLYLELYILSTAYLTVANLDRLEISVQHC